MKGVLKIGEYLKVTIPLKGKKREVQEKLYQKPRSEIEEKNSASERRNRRRRSVRGRGERKRSTVLLDDERKKEGKITLNHV